MQDHRYILSKDGKHSHPSSDSINRRGAPAQTHPPPSSRNHGTCTCKLDITSRHCTIDRVRNTPMSRQPFEIPSTQGRSLSKSNNSTTFHRSRLGLIRFNLVVSTSVEYQAALNPPERRQRLKNPGHDHNLVAQLQFHFCSSGSRSHNLRVSTSGLQTLTDLS